MKKSSKILSFILSCSVVCSSLSILGSASVYYSNEQKQRYNTKRENAVNFFIDNEKKKGDFDGNGLVNTSDARNILKVAAKLYEDLDADTFMYADIDCNGKITSADARTVLRISAKLDTTTQDKSKKLELFNSLVNSIKPSETNALFYYRSRPTAVRYDNQEAVDKFNKEMRDLANNVAVKASFSASELAELKNMNLGTMLTEIDDSDTVVSYKTTGFNVNRLSVEFPLQGDAKGSKLSVNDIADIVYKENDSTEFVIYKALPGHFNEPLSAPYQISGSSITVSFNEESLIAIPDNQQDLSHGKVFNLNLNSGFSTVNNLQPSENDEISTMGEFSGDIDNLTYKNSFIKLYFNNDKLSANFGKPIYIEYNLNYCADIYTHIALAMSLKLLGINVSVNDYITVSTDINELTQYYLPDNK